MTTITRLANRLVRPILLSLALTAGGCGGAVPPQQGNRVFVNDYMRVHPFTRGRDRAVEPMIEEQANTPNTPLPPEKMPPTVPTTSPNH